MKRRHEADTRTRILDAAEELFAEAGYNGSSTAGIAKRAKVPKGLVFHYFPQKMDVLTALIDERTFVEILPVTDVEAVPGDPAGTLSRLARRFPLRASPAMRRILLREADTHRRPANASGASTPRSYAGPTMRWNWPCPAPAATPHGWRSRRLRSRRCCSTRRASSTSPASTSTRTRSPNSSPTPSAPELHATDQVTLSEPGLAGTLA